MRLQSDIDALAAIEEDARAMLKRVGLPNDKQKLEVVICLRQIIDLATYRKHIDEYPEPSAR
ncbi:hypothetical protein [Pseudomonas sp. B22129]|uniref:hypothetical protein n=1 Tax=Pseudomonas sp. B22129 TaxID=3235111 RepID=UPI0037851233